MNLQHLRYVAEVEKTGSITRAAKNLYMGQPNLSKAIKELENEIGITIFRRTRQGVEPTQLGAEFLVYAHTILSQLDELESLYKPQTEREFKLSISVPRASYIALAFADFLKEVPPRAPLSVHFRENSSMGAITDVVNGDSQLALIRYQNIHEEYYLHFLQNMKLAWEPLWKFRMCLLMSREHPLALAREIPYHQLDGYIEIVHGDMQVPSLSFSQISRDARMKGGKRRIYIYDRGSQLDFLRQVQGAYMWESPLPFAYLAENQLVMKECPAAGPDNTELVIYKEDHTLTAAEKQLVGRIRKYTGQL